LGDFNGNLAEDTEALKLDVPGDILSWTDQLETGLEEVDEQHKKLVAIVNKLAKLQARNTAPEELIAVYCDLKNYTLYHFRQEEDEMNAWPVDEAHKATHLKAHRGFIERIGKIDELIDSYPSYVIDHLLAFLVKWLVHHISDVDKRMAREIIALRSGVAVSDEITNKDQLSNTISELYDGIGVRSLEVLDLNIQLQAEIDQRRQAEEEAQLAAQVFENSSDAMTVTDAQNNIIAINPAFTRLTGFHPEDVIGRNPSILSSGRHDQLFYQDMWESITTTGHWDGELWNRHKNGNVFAESLTINTIHRADGSVARRVAVFSDITEKKLTEEKLTRQAAELKDLNALLSQEIAVKNRLFSIVAHDLRSPFTLLLGMTQTVIKKADTYSKDKLIEKVAIINQASKNVFNVMENLLEWSLAQLEGEKLDIQKISLRDIIAEARDVLDAIAEEKGVKIDSVVGEQQICADHHVVLTILRNLLSNAIKFSEKGGSIEVRVQDNSDKIEIAVSDSGVGISEQVIDNLFAVDQKTTTLGTAGESGTGLGLPLCADLVKKLGGSLRVERRSEKGSRFIVVLPTNCSQ
jgi:hemerythrin-like metal-binding protein/PAS domain S-box-containing protein